MKDKEAAEHSETSLLSAFLEHRDTLAAYLAKRVIVPDDIEDIIQEAFTESFTASRRREISSPKSYLFIVARNILSKRFAKERKIVFRELDAAAISTIPTDAPTVDEQLFQRMKIVVLMEAVDALPRQCRRVFILRKFLGMSQKQIASELNISTSTVERHITNAIAKIRSTLQRRGYEDEVSVRRIKPGNSLTG